jgi:hypothetical protein
MTWRELDLTFIGNRAKTCFMAGMTNAATPLSSHWREA